MLTHKHTKSFSKVKFPIFESMRNLIPILLALVVLSSGCDVKSSLQVDLTDKGKETYYKSKLFNGIGFDVYSNGQLKEEWNYKRGMKTAHKVWYENGQLSEEATYYWTGRYIAERICWYDNGQLEYDSRASKAWDRNGNEIKSATYLIKKYSSDNWDAIRNQETIDWD